MLASSAVDRSRAARRGGPARRPCPGRARRAAPRRTPRGAGPARRGAGRRRPPRRAGRAGRSRGRGRPPARWTRRRRAGPGRGRRRATPLASTSRLVGDPAAGDGRRPDHLPGGLVEPVEADQQHLGEVLGDAAPAPRGADQLLDEEGVALGAVDDVGDLGLGAAARGGARGPASAPRRGERVELQPLDTADPGPLGDLAAQRVAAVEVLGAVATTMADRLGEGTGEEEADHVAGGLVGPVGVLDDQEQGGLRRGGVESSDAWPRRGRRGRRSRCRVDSPLQHAAAGLEPARARGGRRRPSRRPRGGRWPAGP